MKRARQIGRNIRFMGISQLLTVTISFILLPFIVSRIGKELYGIYVIAIVINGYFGLIDLGLSNAVLKYVAEYRGKRDEGSLNDVLSALFTFYAVIGIVSAIFMLALSYNFGWFFEVGEGSKETTRVIFLITSFFSLVIWPTKLFQGVIEGVQRSDLKAKVNILIQGCYAGLTYYLLVSGYGAVSLLIATQSLALLGNIFLLILSHRELKGLKIIFPYLKLETFSLIFNFSFYMILCSITIMMAHELGHIIIGTFISVAAVTLFQPAYMIQKGFGTLLGSIMGSSLRVASAEMEGARDYDKQRYHLFTSTRYIMMALMPMVIIVIFFMKPFIYYWMGSDFSESVIVAQILVFYWIFNGMLEVGHGILFAKGMAKDLFVIQFIDASAFIISSLALVSHFGIVGVAMGTVIAKVFVSFPMMLNMILKTMNITFADYLRSALRWLVPLSILAVIFCWTAIKLYYPENIFVLLIEMGFIYSGLIAFSYLFLMDHEDHKNLRAIIGI